MKLQKTNTVLGISDSGFTDLLEIEVESLSQINFEVVVTEEALGSIRMMGKVHPDSDYVIVVDTMLFPGGPLVLATSGNVGSQAAGTTGWGVVNVLGFHMVKFQARADVAGANVTIRAAGRN